MKTSVEFNRSASPVAAQREFNNTLYTGKAQKPRRSIKVLAAGLVSGSSVALLLATAVFSNSTAAQAAEIAIGISLHVGPPPIPVYTQPPCPAPGYMWTPGYWAFDLAAGYYWVPGTWVAAPAPGVYWTPGYWGWGGDLFVWHAGYWGPHVGFYGGINYGFGYTGVGFVGGEWRGGAFFYNRSIVNLGGAHITNVYYHSVPNNFAVNRVSYNGGAGGLGARPTPGDLAAEHDRHIAATSLQHDHEMAAHNDRAQFASVNHGKPGVAATGRPGELRGAGAVAPVRAGGAVNPASYRAANSEHGAPGESHAPSTQHSTGFSGYHNPNAPAGTHAPATGGAFTPRSPAPSTAERGSAPSGFHSSTTPTRNAPSSEPPSNKGNAYHPAGAPQQHGPSKPAGGEKKEGHESEPRR